MDASLTKLLVICGPTATGKTALGFKLAKEFNGEIVSADSRQVYKGMDIITGKEVNKDIPTWLIDVVNPDQEFNVALFKQLAQRVIRDIWRRGKLPIVVGGTGLYIKSLLEPIGTLGVPPDWKLRQRLEKLGVKDLGERLKKIAPERWERMNESDRHNPRRLIRAIEIASQEQKSKIKDQKYNLKIKKFLILGLKTADFTDLYKRIDQRVEKRIKLGAEREVKSLLKHYSWQNSVLRTTIGYKEWQGYLAGKATLDEIKKRWQFAEHAYARRQMTWFKKQPKVVWLDVNRRDFDNQAINIVQKWYGQN